MKQSFLLTSLLLLGSLVGFAQTETPSSAVSPTEANAPIPAENEKIIGITQQFYSALTQYFVSKENNMDPIVQLLDKEFVLTRFVIDVSGKQTKSTSDLANYRMQLDALKKIDGLRSEYKIERFNFIKTYESFATVTFTVFITSYIQDETVVRFRSQVTNYLKREPGGEWRIYQSNALNVYKEQEIGVCPCALTKLSKDETKYEAKVLYPAGTNFNAENIEFEFKQSEAKILAIAGNNAYLIEKGEVICVKDKGQVVSNKLGKATTKPEAIMLILSQQLFSSNCIGFKSLSK